MCSCQDFEKAKLLTTLYMIKDVPENEQQAIEADYAPVEGRELVEWKVPPTKPLGDWVRASRLKRDEAWAQEYAPQSTQEAREAAKEGESHPNQSINPCSRLNLTHSFTTFVILLTTC